MSEPSSFEFLPLMAPRVEARNPSPPTPVNWYQKIAPRLAEKPLAEEDRPGLEAAESGGVTRRVAFGSVEEIARRERARQQQGEPEPVEIRHLREEAEAAARLLLVQAQEQARILEDQSRREGYQAGYDAGYTVGREDVTALLTRQAEEDRAACREELAAFVAHIEAERRKVWAELEPEMIGLVFELAKKVIKMEVEASRQAALAVVQNALRRVADAGTLRIRVHTDDLETVRANREELLTLVDGNHHIEIIADRRIGPGGCIVETDAGTIDARIETQVEEVGKMLEQTVLHREGQN